VTFTGEIRLEPHPEGAPGQCLATRGRLRLRFPEPVVQVRLTFCQDPHRSAPGATGRLTVRRDEAGGRETVPCAIDVPYEVYVEGRTWVVSAPGGLDCLDVTRPAPLEAICFVTLAEAERAGHAKEQCEQNDAAIGRFGEVPPVLKPGTYYRLVVKSTVDVDLIHADPEILDILYEAALDALTGSTGAGTFGFLQEAFFRTTGPPKTLRPYVKWSSPEEQTARVFRDDDLRVRFLRPTVRAMFDAAPHALTAIVRDAEGRHATGYEIGWTRAATPTLLPDETVWLAHLEDAPAPAPDDVLEVRRAVLVADDFDDPSLKGWEVLDLGGTRAAQSPWRIAGGELRCILPAFGGGVGRHEVAKPGPMVIATAGDLHATGSTRSLVFTVDLRSDSGDAIGVVFGYVDRTRHYRFSMDDTQRYRRLVKVAGGAVTVLFETPDGFERDEPHEIEVTFGPGPEGQQLRVRIDGRARETAATVARLHAENATLRQRVAELERLVGQLKRRLWPGT
jgi:hypothetical protein